jgi:hypothetical protein
MNMQNIGGKIETGKTYIFNIPPSWIVGGTVVDQDDTHVYLTDGIYVESIGDGYSALGSIAMASDSKGLKDAVTKSYPLKDGTAFRRDALLIHVECNRDLQPLSRSEEAKAIKRAGGR